MGKSVDCSCGGSNENCALCGGLGEYTIRFGERLRAPKRKQPKKDSSPDLLPLIDKLGSPKEKADARIKLSVRVDGQGAICPHSYCDFRGSRDEVYRHMQGSHPNSERPTANRYKELECRKQMQCPLCDATLNRADFFIHLRDKHNTAWETVEQITQRTSVRGLSGAESSYKVQCPLCATAVPLRGINSHLASRHATEIEHLRRLVRKKEHKTGNRSPEKLFKSKSVVQRTQEDTLEAHRGLGFVIREHGRYGSHPLHDKHDDESMP